MKKSVALLSVLYSWPELPAKAQQARKIPRIGVLDLGSGPGDSASMDVLRYRSATSIGIKYREACRGRSTVDVIAKLRIVEEEADESAY